MHEVLDIGSRRFFCLTEVPELFAAPGEQLRVLIFADDLHPTNVVQDHILAFSKYSDNDITIINPRKIKTLGDYISSDYDALVIHYSIFVIAESYLPLCWQGFISTFSGPVVAIHEDEYQQINAFTEKFAELGVQAIFSCLDSKETLERVYGNSALLPETLIFSCLPGYVSPELLNLSCMPISKRQYDVIYRGRELRPELGRVAQEKRQIGLQMAALARAYGLKYDISSSETDRIYGSDWPKFLMSGKAMLGVEGGASIFDFDGSIHSAVNGYLKKNPTADFDEVWENVLKIHEGNIDFRTITPKFFEAIATRTALVLYPGKYNDILVPERHFIPLERDGSNIDDVVKRLKDNDFLQSMTNRAHEEVLTKHELSVRFYVNQFDKVLCSIFKNRVAGKVFYLRHIAPHFKRFNSQRSGAIRQITEMQEQLALRDDQLMKMQKTCEAYEELSQNLLSIFVLFFKVFIQKLKTRLRIRL